MCLSEEQEISVRFRGDPHHKVIEESGLSRFIWDEEHVGSNPTYLTYTPLAQLEEHLSYIQDVVSSILTGGTKKQVTHKWWCASLPNWNRVGSIPSTCSIGSLGEFGRPRLPVTQKITGSNPV
jgi:hypothetical protein